MSRSTATWFSGSSTRPMKSMNPSSTKGNSSTSSPIMACPLCPMIRVCPGSYASGMAAKFVDETPVGLKRRARRINRELAETYPDAHCELDFTTPLELSVATILSAQSTDKGVNVVTPTLFHKYPDAAAYAAADRAELEELIHSTGFFRNKATSLIKLGTMLVENFD